MNTPQPPQGPRLRPGPPQGQPVPAPHPYPAQAGAQHPPGTPAGRPGAQPPRPGPTGTGNGPHVFAIVLGIVALLLAAYHIAILIHHLAVIRLGAAPIPALMPVLEFVPAPPINVHLAVVISCAPLLASEPSCSSGTVRRSWPHRSPPASTSSYWSATSSSPRFR